MPAALRPGHQRSQVSDVGTHSVVAAPIRALVCGIETHYGSFLSLPKQGRRGALQCIDECLGDGWGDVHGSLEALVRCCGVACTQVCLCFLAVLLPRPSGVARSGIRGPREGKAKCGAKDKQLFRWRQTGAFRVTDLCLDPSSPALIGRRAPSKTTIGVTPQATSS
jgi:hypothetical protein